MRIIESNIARPELLVIECDCDRCFAHLAVRDVVECPVCHRKADLSILEKVAV